MDKSVPARDTLSSTQDLTEWTRVYQQETLYRQHKTSRTGQECTNKRQTLPSTQDLTDWARVYQQETKLYRQHKTSRTGQEFTSKRQDSIVNTRPHGLDKSVPTRDKTLSSTQDLTEWTRVYQQETDSIVNTRPHGLDKSVPARDKTLSSTQDLTDWARVYQQETRLYRQHKTSRTGQECTSKRQDSIVNTRPHGMDKSVPTRDRLYRQHKTSRTGQEFTSKRQTLSSTQDLTEWTRVYQQETDSIVNTIPHGMDKSLPARDRLYRQHKTSRNGQECTNKRQTLSSTQDLTDWARVYQQETRLYRQHKTSRTGQEFTSKRQDSTVNKDLTDGQETRALLSTQDLTDWARVYQPETDSTVNTRPHGMDKSLPARDRLYRQHNTSRNGQEFTSKRQTLPSTQDLTDWTRVYQQETDSIDNTRPHGLDKSLPTRDKTLPTTQDLTDWARVYQQETDSTVNTIPHGMDKSLPARDRLYRQHKTSRTGQECTNKRQTLSSTQDLTDWARVYQQETIDSTVNTRPHGMDKSLPARDNRLYRQQRPHGRECTSKRQTLSSTDDTIVPMVSIHPELRATTVKTSE
ncbi:predicted protein [Nematostella vectensis]|uniref:Uncharacterized protein n=1 Tax=Nematostella vectensis TaxID=45351 RepID=A7SFE3_NEMVE|nr:predicted protein [Nematostella vectensis]|eukprot:XP_001629603.1 predicted protein [Nematostella vectensis]